TVIGVGKRRCQCSVFSDVYPEGPRRRREIRSEKTMNQTQVNEFHLGRSIPPAYGMGISCRRTTGRKALSGAGASGKCREGGERGGGDGLGGDGRELDDESRPFAGGGFDPDAAAVVDDDRLAGGEAQAGPSFAALVRTALRRVVAVEDPRKLVGRNAAAGVP